MSTDPTPTGTPTDPVTGQPDTETAGLSEADLAALSERVDALEAAPAPSSDGLVAKFAVYDDKLLRFVEGIFAKKPTKAEAKALVGHERFTVREVF